MGGNGGKLGANMEHMGHCECLLSAIFVVLGYVHTQ